MSVAAWSGSLLAWGRELAADRALSGVARMTGWQLAEQAGLALPYRRQSLLLRSAWEADGLRHLVRAEVLAMLGDAGGVLVVDETAFLKKGTHSAGVARQYALLIRERLAQTDPTTLADAQRPALDGRCGLRAPAVDRPLGLIEQQHGALAGADYSAAPSRPNIRGTSIP